MLKERNVVLQNKKIDIKDQFNRTDEQMKEVNNKLNNLRSELTNKDNLFKNLKSNKENSLAKFGTQLVHLVILLN